jgi:hypothetical protein
MKLSGESGHLTYCTNVHRGETWDEVWDVLRNDVLAVREDVAPDQAFAIGLRLSGVALGQASQPDALEQMKGISRTTTFMSPRSMLFLMAPFMERV